MVTPCRNLLDGFAPDALTFISGGVVRLMEPTKLRVSEMIDSPPESRCHPVNTAEQKVFDVSGVVFVRNLKKDQKFKLKLFFFKMQASFNNFTANKTTI